MPLDPHVRRLLAMMALGGAAPPGPEQRRQAQRLLARLAGTEALPVIAQAVTLPLPSGAREARLFTPLACRAPGPGIVFLHGGGLVAGDLDTHDAIGSRLAAASACRVLAVGYRLAPEHPFPAAIEDAVAAMHCVAAMARRLGIDPEHLAVAGESAGAGLAARLCQELRGTGPAIAAQLLLCPVLDLRCIAASHREFASGYLLDAATVRHDIEACGIAGLVDTPRVSPLLEPDLTGLPPARIHTAACDPFRDDGAAYAERLAKSGVSVVQSCHPGMIHFFYGLGRLVPAARPLLSQIAADFGALLRGDAALPAHSPMHDDQRRTS